MLVIEKVEKLLRDNKSYEEIAEQLGSNKETVRKFVYRKCQHILAEIEENNNSEIKRYYKKGYSSSEIEEIIGVPARTIRKYIAENLTHLKAIHDLKAKEKMELKKNIKKDDERLFRQTMNRFMSVGEFVRRNMSAYDQQNDGSYKFNGKYGLAACDVPIIYKANI